MPTLTGSTPYFEVFDMMASKAFYCDMLGFEVVFASPEVETREGKFSHFMHLRRGAAELMLNTAYDSNTRPERRDAPRWSGCRHVALYIEVDNVEGLFTELIAQGLRTKPPALSPYGRLAFAVRDPDGHGLTFQGSAPSTQPGA